MILFRTSVLAASAVLLTSLVQAQTSANVPNDSLAASQFQWTPHSSPTDSEQPNAETDPNVGTAGGSMWSLSKNELAAAPTRRRNTSSLQDPSASSKGLPDWRIDLYPVFAWVPIFGANASLPGLPSPVPAPSGSVSGSFNGAAFAGFGIEKSKWSTYGNLLWASLSGERQMPFVKIDTNFIYGQFMLGREVLPNLFAEAGFRRTAIKITATVSIFPQVTWKPGIWDPLVGLTYRHSLGRKWHFRIHGDGGGFGVGNDVSVSGTASAEWRFARHFGILLGYGFLYFRDSGVVVGQPFKIKETLNGPMFGFGLHFGRAESAHGS